MNFKEYLGIARDARHTSESNVVGLAYLKNTSEVLVEGSNHFMKILHEHDACSSKSVYQRWIIFLRDNFEEAVCEKVSYRQFKASKDG